MPKTNSEIDKIIKELDETEKKVLTVLGKEDISENKNIRLETIQKKLSDTHAKKVNKTIKSLKNKQLIRVYRHKNYVLNQLGRKVAQKLKKDFQNQRYKDLSRILMIHI